MQAHLSAQMSRHPKSRRDAMQARLNGQMSQHSLLVSTIWRVRRFMHAHGWAVFGLFCVVLVGYALHKGLYIGKHIDYRLDARYECSLGTCKTVPGYQLHCTYWTAHGTFREGGGFAYPTYDEAAEHSSCRMFQI
jgi:hypothetical protein